MAPRIVAYTMCHNNWVYMQNLVPILKRMADRVIVVDDCSTDGTQEWLLKQRDVDVIIRKFDNNFSNQRNAAMEHIDNGDWVMRIDSDELPSTWLTKNLRTIVPYYESVKCNRTNMPIYHMINFCMCKTEVGFEIRLFKKNETCLYKGKCHEIMDAEFGEGTTQLELPGWGGLIHWKYADRLKIKETEDVYLPNNLYDETDWKNRLNGEASYLPANIIYEMNDDLACHLIRNNPNVR